MMELELGLGSCPPCPSLSSRSFSRLGSEDGRWFGTACLHKGAPSWDEAGDGQTKLCGGSSAPVITSLALRPIKLLETPQALPVFLCDIQKM